MKKRHSFIFYASYYDAICDLPAEEQGQMYKAIVDYAMTQQEPLLKGQLNSYFKLIKPNIDAGIRRYENGLKGGAPIGNSNAKKQPKNNLETTENQPKNNLKTTRYISRLYQEQEQEQEKEQEQEQENEHNKQNIVSSMVENLVKELNDKINQTFDDTFVFDDTPQRLFELIDRIAKEPDCKINKTSIPNYKVLQSFLNLFNGDKTTVQQRFYETFEIIDSKPDIANKYKYAVGVLYNKACGY